MEIMIIESFYFLQHVHGCVSPPRGHFLESSILNKIIQPMFQELIGLHMGTNYAPPPI